MHGAEEEARNGPKKNIMKSNNQLEFFEYFREIEIEVMSFDEFFCHELIYVYIKTNK